MRRIQKTVRSVLCLGGTTGNGKEELREEAPEMSAKARGLAATIPQELFFNILGWVIFNDTRRDTYDRLLSERIRNPRRKKSLRSFQRQLKQEMARAGAAATLRSCSLVSLYWANQCREYMFRGARLRIWSLQKALDFRKYSTDGCRSLVPICTLIRSIDVVISCNKTQRSFLDLVYLPQMRGKLDCLRIYGPLPEGLPPTKLDTPHWSLTNLATPPPSVTAYEHVYVNAIDFPSFRHLVKYFKYFDSAVEYYLKNLTWSSKTPSTPSHLFKPPARRRQSIRVYATRCTDDVALCIQIAMMYPDFPLREVSSQDHLLASHLINIIADFYRHAPQAAAEDAALEYELRCWSGSKDARHYTLSLEVSQVPLNYVEVSVLISGRDNTTPNSSIESGRVSHLRSRITGIVVVISSSKDVEDYSKLTPIDLTSLKTSVQQHYKPITFVIIFTRFSLLELFAERYPTLLEEVEDRMPIFLCQCSKEHPVPGPDSGSDSEENSADPYTKGFVEVDDSLTGTGRQWMSDLWREVAQDILEPPVSRSPSIS